MVEEVFGEGGVCFGGKCCFEIGFFVGCFVVFELYLELLYYGVEVGFLRGMQYQVECQFDGFVVEVVVQIGVFCILWVVLCGLIVEGSVS